MYSSIRTHVGDVAEGKKYVLTGAARHVSKPRLGDFDRPVTHLSDALTNTIKVF